MTFIRPPAWQIAGYLALSHGWTWAFWWLAARQGTSVWDWPASLYFYIGGAGVVLGGVVMTALVTGRRGLRELGSRLVDWRRPRPRWWVVVLLLYPLLSLIAAGVARLLGGVERPLDPEAIAGRIADPLGLLAMIGFVLIIGPLPEEIGWRAYLQERLQRYWGAFGASLVVGVVWWSWHLPLYTLPGYYDAFDRGPPAPLGFLVGYSSRLYSTPGSTTLPIAASSRSWCCTSWRTSRASSSAWRTPFAPIGWRWRSSWPFWSSGGRAPRALERSGRPIR